MDLNNIKSDNRDNLTLIKFKQINNYKIKKMKRNNINKTDINEI